MPSKSYPQLHTITLVLLFISALIQFKYLSFLLLQYILTNLAYSPHLFLSLIFNLTPLVLTLITIIVLTKRRLNPLHILLIIISIFIYQWLTGITSQIKFSRLPHCLITSTQTTNLPDSSTNALHLQVRLANYCLQTIDVSTLSITLTNPETPISPSTHSFAINHTLKPQEHFDTHQSIPIPPGQNPSTTTYTLTPSARYH